MEQSNAAQRSRAARGGAKTKVERVRVAREIAELMVELAAPRPDDVLFDPWAGTCDVLAVAGAFITANFPALLRDAQERGHFERRMFCAADTDPAMLQAGIRQLSLAGIEYVATDHADMIATPLGAHASGYSRVLGIVPFAGSAGAISKDLRPVLNTKRRELLSVSRVMQLLRGDARAVLVVPESMLCGATKAHVKLRSMLAMDYYIEAVIALPGQWLIPRAAGPAAILCFSKSPAADRPVWFCELEPGAVADVKERIRSRRATPSAELERTRSEASFCVPLAEIATQGYDLSLKRYQLAVPTQIEQRKPHEILAELADLEAQIFGGLKELVGMLK
jgi:type I restriction enzyme M protein